jgi:hypothetical protein
MCEKPDLLVFLFDQHAPNFAGCHGNAIASAATLEKNGRAATAAPIPLKRFTGASPWPAPLSPAPSLPWRGLAATA